MMRTGNPYVTVANIGESVSFGSMAFTGKMAAEGKTFTYQISEVNGGYPRRDLQYDGLHRQGAGEPGGRSAGRFQDDRKGDCHLYR